MRRAAATAVTILAFGLGLGGGAVIGQHQADARVAAAQEQTRQAQQDAEKLARHLDYEATRDIALNDSCWLVPRLTRWVWVRDNSGTVAYRVTFEQAWKLGAEHQVRAVAWCDQ